MIANDDLIRALEILELTCEQLSVRVNLLDHLAFGRGKRPASQKRKASQDAKWRSAATGQGGGWGIWKMLGFGESSDASNGGQADPVNQQRDGEGRDNEPTAGEDKEESETVIEPELDRCAAIVFYTYPRLPRDVPGLLELRAKLILRWGNDFANRIQEDDCPIGIPEELVERLQVRRPPATLVEMYLKEIARSHGIPWQQEENEGGDEGSGEGGGTPQKQEQETPPKYNADDPSLPQSKIAGHDIPKSHPFEDKMQPDTGTAAEEKSGGIPEVDELARRFAALKR